MATKIVEITPPKIGEVHFTICGTAPYVQHKFSAKARKQMLDAQIAVAKNKKKEPRNPEADYLGAIHFDKDGKPGIPAPAFRSALIDACRMAGFVMTKAKCSLFCIADAVDVDDGTPLVHIEGEHEMNESAVRLESGVASIAFRPMWREWSARVRIDWDMDQFSVEDVTNLMDRAGRQIGIGEGRPFSKKSNGMGWGTFTIDSVKVEE